MSESLAALLRNMFSNIKNWLTGKPNTFIKFINILVSIESVECSGNVLEHDPLQLKTQQIVQDFKDLLTKIALPFCQVQFSGFIMKSVC